VFVLISELIEWDSVERGQSADLLMSSSRCPDCPANAERSWPLLEFAVASSLRQALVDFEVDARSQVRARRCAGDAAINYYNPQLLPADQLEMTASAVTTTFLVLAGLARGQPPATMGVPIELVRAIAT
jgi:hypothetical protein